MNDRTHPPDRPGRPDRPDRSVKVPHLVMALLFAGTVALWALVASDRVGTGQVAFLVPGVLVAAGVLGLVASVLSARNRADRPAPAPPFAGSPVAGPPVVGPRPHRRDDLDDALEDDREDDPGDDPEDDLEHTAPVTPARPTDQLTDRPTAQPRPEPEESR